MPARTPCPPLQSFRREAVGPQRRPQLRRRPEKRLRLAQLALIVGPKKSPKSSALPRRQLSGNSWTDRKVCAYHAQNQFCDVDCRLILVLFLILFLNRPKHLVALYLGGDKLSVKDLTAPRALRSLERHPAAGWKGSDWDPSPSESRQPSLARHARICKLFNFCPVSLFRGSYSRPPQPSLMVGPIDGQAQGSAWAVPLI
jgi:hypothetical protein